MNKRWTAEENETITQLKAAGLTYKQMVSHLPGRSVRAIAVQANKILPSSRPTMRDWTQKEEEQLISLRLENTPYKEIAEKLNRSYAAVKTKGSQLIVTGKPKGRDIMTYEARVRDALSDLNSQEVDFVDTGQLFFSF